MWQRLGGDVWSAPWVKITHSGDYTFAGQFKNMLEINAIRRQLEAQAKETAPDSTEEKK
jgi:hypothetical protein